MTLKCVDHKQIKSSDTYQIKLYIHTHMTSSSKNKFYSENHVAYWAYSDLAPILTTWTFFTCNTCPSMMLGNQFTPLFCEELRLKPSEHTPMTLFHGNHFLIPPMSLFYTALKYLYVAENSCNDAWLSTVQIPMLFKSMAILETWWQIRLFIGNASLLTILSHSQLLRVRT